MAIDNQGAQDGGQQMDQGGNARQDQERQAGVNQQQGQQNRQQGGDGRDMTDEEGGQRDQGLTGNQGDEAGTDQDA